MVTKYQWSYLAGLFDGEGSVTILSYERKRLDGRGYGPYTYLQHEILVSIKNTNLALMKWLVATFGGVYYTQEYDTPKWKTAYLWRVKGARNKERFLLGVLPYLIIKRDVALAGLDYLRLGCGNCPEKRKALAQRCKELNHRGKSVETNTLGSESSEMIEPDLIGDNESALAVMQVA